ncbi:MAG: MFS transporter [Proteobacteria bacterium]|nr:MFS transporter [Pseudomonadota bacterium]
MSTPESTATGGVSGTSANKVRRYTLIMLTVVYTSNFIDRQIMNVLLEPIKNDFGATDTMMGFLTGFSFAIFYATLGIPVAMMADKVNRRNVITAALTVWSVMTALGGAAQNFWQLAAARIGVGIGEAGASPPSHSMIADLYPAEERVSAMAIYSTGIQIGSALGFFIGGWLAYLFNWQVAFLVVGLPGLILAFVFRRTVTEPKRGGADGKSADFESVPLVVGARQVISALRPARFGKSEESKTLIAAFNHLWHTKSLRHAIIGCTFVAFIGYGGVAFGASFLIRSHGLTLSEVATFFSLAAAIFGSGGAILAGLAADKLALRDVRWVAWIVAATKITAIPLIIVFYLADNLWMVLPIYPLIMALGATYQGSTFSMVQTLSPLRYRSQASAILLFVINLIGLGLGPWAVGALSEALRPEFGQDSLRYALLAMSMLGIWGAFHYYLAGRHYRDDLANAHAEGVV